MTLTTWPGAVAVIAIAAGIVVVTALRRKRPKRFSLRIEIDSQPLEDDKGSANGDGI